MDHAPAGDDSEPSATDEVEQYLGMFDGDRGLAATWVAAKRHDDVAARERLVITYGPLVRYVVSRMNVSLPPSLERADLVGFGTLGLIDAIERFDLDRGLTFQTYGVTRIRGAILDELRAVDWVPRAVRGTMHRIDRATAGFEQEHGREPTIDDVVSETGLGSAEVRATLLAYQNGYLVSLQDRMSSDSSADDDRPGRDFVDSTAVLPDEEYDHAESQRQLRGHIRRLRQRDRVVVALYYFEELTFAEIGRVLGVSESRACQVHSRAIRTLRETAQ